MHVTSSALPPRLLPAAARTFRDRFRTTFGARRRRRRCRPTRPPTPSCTRSARRARRATTARAVTKAFFAIRDRESVLGRYSIDRFGDTSLSRYAGNRVDDSEFVLDKLLEVRR